MNTYIDFKHPIGHKFFFALATILFFCGSWVSAQTPFNYGSFWANHFAMKMTEVKTLDDVFRNLNFSQKNIKEIKNDLSSKSNPNFNLKYKVYGSQIYIISNKNEKTILDFAKFKQKKILLNKKYITINSEKTYLNYKLEVEQILKTSKNVSLIELLHTAAYAQSNESWFGSFLGSIVSAISDSTNFRTNEIGSRSDLSSAKDALIESYVYEDRLARQSASYDKKRANLTTLVFFCEGEYLTSVQERAVVVNGRVGFGSSIKEGRKLIKVQGGGYEFIHGNFGVQGARSCKSLIDDYGVVSEISDKSTAPVMCPSVGLNIFNDPKYFGAFPSVAAKCCQTNGCYKSVTERRDQIIKDLIEMRGNKPGQEASDSGAVE